MKKASGLKAVLAATTAITGISAGALHAETLMMMEPAISKNNIAFVYAGDIWVADRDGSDARRLTSHQANEGRPHFSPDGKMIAFTADYDGNTDVYLISTAGGQPTRLTYHPDADNVQGWTPDGSKVLFTSRREMKSGRSAQAWEISKEGGFPTKVMEAVVNSASWSKDGKNLAYSPYNTAHRGASGWRNHRGGTVPPVWIMDVATNSYEEVPHVRASDTDPVWIGDDVYFLSDRSGVRNIHKYDTGTKTVTQVTKEETWDILSVDAHANNLVYNAGGRLKTVDARRNKVRELKIDINPDLPELRPQWKDAMPSLELAGLSPTGKRAVLSARGEIFTVPLKDGSTRNLTKSSGVRERDALWSPKGGEIAYTSDESGEQRLVIVKQDGSGEKRSFDLGSPADYTLHLWAGDGSRILYYDNHLTLWSINLNSGERTKIVTNNRRAGFNTALSGDGRWLAYTKARRNYFNDLYLYDFETGTSTPLTDGMSHADAPAFSPDGKYLYFAASTNSGPTQVGLDLSTQERPIRYSLYAAVLAEDGKSPLLPKSDEEEVKEDKPDTGKTEDKTDGTGENGDDKAEQDKKAKKKETPVTKIDLDGLSDRIVALPVASRAYSSLAVDANGALFFLQHPQPGGSIEPNGRPPRDSQLMRFDPKDKKVAKILDKVNGFSLSNDGKMFIALMSDNKLKTAKIEKKIKAKPLNVKEVKALINPREEWVQIFNEVWRTERDYFYADNLHGLDWAAIRDRYRPLVDHVGRRADLNRLMVEMIAEFEVGHNRIFGGDIPRQKGDKTGLLGADLRLEDGQYKIKRIYDGENWNPYLDAPLAAPGIGAKEGDTLLAVNGTPVDASQNVYALFAGTVGKQVTLKVSSDGTFENAKDVTVKPIANERRLRNWAWVEGNRKAVEAATDGKVGYVYLPNTTTAGFTYFNRMFFAQTDKQAMVIDERQNGGGQAANYITDVLSRTYLGSWKDRDGMVFDTPGGAVYGPKVMLIDQDAGSGGDFLPYSFRHMGIGKLIGKTTWGGLIGIAANRRTIDGGFTTVPFFRFFTPDGEWRIENEGVAPDIEVTLDPTLVNVGRDSQLEAGIAEVLKQLETFTPVKRLDPPADPTELGK